MLINVWEGTIITVRGHSECIKYFKGIYMVTKYKILDLNTKKSTPLSLTNHQKHTDAGKFHVHSRSVKATQSLEIVQISMKVPKLLLCISC